MGKDLNGQEPERARASVGKSLNEQWAKASVGKNFYGQRGSVGKGLIGSGLHGQRPYWAFLKTTKLATRNSEP